MGNIHAVALACGHAIAVSSITALGLNVIVIIRYCNQSQQKKAKTHNFLLSNQATVDLLGSSLSGLLLLEWFQCIFS